MCVRFNRIRAQKRSGGPPRHCQRSSDREAVEPFKRASTRPVEPFVAPSMTTSTPETALKPVPITDDNGPPAPADMSVDTKGLTHRNPIPLSDHRPGTLWEATPARPGQRRTAPRRPNPAASAAEHGPRGAPTGGQGGGETRAPSYGLGSPHRKIFFRNFLRVYPPGYI